MEFVKEVNGHLCRAQFADSAIADICLPLLRKLTVIQKKKDRRILAFLAAPPGAGKTTLSLLLQELSEKEEDITPLQAVGMDGFHYRQEYLQTHFTGQNGTSVSLAAIKGAPATFDLPSFTRYIQTLAEGETCRWPEYSRRIHDPIENAVAISRDIVLIEGNYLLLDYPGWRELKQYADYTVFMEAEEEDVRARLIERKQAGGVSREKAAAHVEQSDLPNARLCMEHRLPADFTLKISSINPSDEGNR